MSEEEKRIRRLRNVKSRVREDMQVNSEQGPTLGGMVERGGRKKKVQFFENLDCAHGWWLLPVHYSRLHQCHSRRNRLDFRPLHASTRR